MSCVSKLTRLGIAPCEEALLLCLKFVLFAHDSSDLPTMLQQPPGTNMDTLSSRQGSSVESSCSTLRRHDPYSCAVLENGSSGHLPIARENVHPEKLADAMSAQVYSTPVPTATPAALVGHVSSDNAPFGRARTYSAPTSDAVGYDALYDAPPAYRVRNVSSTVAEYSGVAMNFGYSRPNYVAQDHSISELPPQLHHHHAQQSALPRQPASSRAHCYNCSAYWPATSSVPSNNREQNAQRRGRSNSANLIKYPEYIRPFSAPNYKLEELLQLQKVTAALSELKFGQHEIQTVQYGTLKIPYEQFYEVIPRTVRECGLRLNLFGEQLRSEVVLAKPHGVEFSSYGTLLYVGQTVSPTHIQHCGSRLLIEEGAIVGGIPTGRCVIPLIITLLIAKYFNFQIIGECEMAPKFKMIVPFLKNDAAKLLRHYPTARCFFSDPRALLVIPSHVAAQVSARFLEMWEEEKLMTAHRRDEEEEESPQADRQSSRGDPELPKWPVSIEKKKKKK